MNDFQEVKTGPDDILERFRKSPAREKQPHNPEHAKEAAMRARIVPDARVALERLKSGFISEEAFQHKVLRDRLAAEQKALYASEKLNMSYQDPITGLPNANAFEAGYDTIVRKAEKAGKKLSIMFFDNEGLRLVNDGISYEAGSSMLAVTGAVLRAALGKDGKVYRFGGDEFLAVIQGDIEKGRHLFDGIDAKLKPEQEIKYLDGDGNTVSFKKKIVMRATLTQVDFQNPRQAVAKARTGLNEVKTEQKKKGGNFLLPITS